MSKPSLKKTIIRNLAAMSSLEDFKGQYISLITAFGLITGEAVFKDDESTNQFLSKFCESISDEYKKENEIEFPLSGDDGYLILKNATILSTSNMTSNFGDLVVFFDQIIAASFGTLTRE